MATDNFIKQCMFVNGSLLKGIDDTTFEVVGKIKVILQRMAKVKYNETNCQAELHNQ